MYQRYSYTHFLIGSFKFRSDYPREKPRYSTEVEDCVGLTSGPENFGGQKVYFSLIGFLWVTPTP
jgi:hypothetical protein